MVCRSNSFVFGLWPLSPQATWSRRSISVQLSCGPSLSHTTYGNLFDGWLLGQVHCYEQLQRYNQALEVERRYILWCVSCLSMRILHCRCTWTQPSLNIRPPTCLLSRWTLYALLSSSDGPSSLRMASTSLQDMPMVLWMCLILTRIRTVNWSPLWRVSSTPSPSIRLEHSADVRALKFSPTGNQLFSGSNDMSINCYDCDEEGHYNLLRTYQGHTGYVLGLDITKDGAYMASVYAFFPGSFDDLALQIRLARFGKWRLGSAFRPLPPTPSSGVLLSIVLATSLCTPQRRDPSAFSFVRLHK